MNREALLAPLQHPNVRAFLHVLREFESSQKAEAYRTLYGGGLFDSYDDHPRTKVTAGAYTSTAAGAYQILERTHDGLRKQYGFTDFTPSTQDEMAVALIAGRSALQDVMAGRFDEAIAKCNKEWASLPGSPYGQPTATLEQARMVYGAWGGQYDVETFNPDSLDTEHYEGKEPYEYTPYTPQEAPVAFPLIPLLTAFGPQLLAMIPQLGSLFGSGSEVQVRNVRAATMAVDAIVKATESPNLQAAIERMQSDPSAAQTARAAVAEVMALVEVGGGGIAEARKAASNTEQLPFYKNSAFVFWATVAPLVYAGVYAVLFGASNFSDDAKMMVLTALFTGVLGAGTGFFMGSSLGSQRKTTMLGDK